MNRETRQLIEHESEALAMLFMQDLSESEMLDAVTDILASGIDNILVLDIIDVFLERIDWEDVSAHFESAENIF